MGCVDAVVAAIIRYISPTITRHGLILEVCYDMMD